MAESINFTERISQLKADLVKNNPNLLFKIEESLFEEIVVNFSENEIEALIHFFKFKKENLALFKTMIKTIMNDDIACKAISESLTREIVENKDLSNDQNNHSEILKSDESSGEEKGVNKPVQNPVEGSLAERNDKKKDQNEVLKEDEKKKETCRFLKFGKCKHGWTGKKPDQGKTCSYNHPKVCQKQEKYGKCYDHNCKKFHLKICREYMDTLNCTYGENCKFFHPVGLEEFRMSHERRKFNSSQENPTDWNNTRTFYGRNQTDLSQHNFSYQNQEQNTQGSFLEETLVRLSRRLEQIEMKINQW